MEAIQKAIESIGGKMIPIKEWEEDDTIKELLEQDGREVRDLDKNLIIMGEMARLGYADVSGFRFQVCQDWIPLWRMNSWDDCMKLAEPGQLYAIAAEDYSAQEKELEKAHKLLETVGFEVNTFEGF